MRARSFGSIFAAGSLLFLSACKHPLSIVGEGDIVDLNDSGRGCTLEQFRAMEPACTENEVSGDYDVNYKAVPRPGWRFVRWEGPCSQQSDFQHCRLSVADSVNEWWDENHADKTIPASTAVFQRISGETGFIAGTPVAGLAYETESKTGVTDIEGSFQYEPGETVRFSIGNTLVGESDAAPELTLFDLAGSPVITTTVAIEEALAIDGHPFHQVVNIAVLLRSLDDDADPATGIQLRRKVVALLDGVRLDMSEDWRHFRREFDLRHVVGKSSATRRFSVVHGVINAAPAVQHLYDDLEIDAKTHAVIAIYGDVDADGEPEASHSFFYDELGNLVREEVDEGADGSLEGRRESQYSGIGNVTREVVSDSLSIPFGRRETRHWGYDDLGYLNLVEWDKTGDGVRDAWETRQNDINGNVIRRESQRSVTTYQYDVNGNLLLERESVNGEFRSVVEYSYDERGNLTRIEDGKELDIYEYDASDNRVRHEEWYDRTNATPNVVETWGYDAGNRLRWYERSFGDFDGNGRSDRIMRTEYDVGGNEVRYLDDQNGDGDPEYEETSAYDDRGNIVYATRDDNGDGQPEVVERWSYEYDGQGNPIRSEQDGNDDGVADFITTWQYDSRGNVLRYSEGEPEDPHRFIETWRYDGNDNVIENAQDFDGDETPDEIDTLDYLPTGWGHILENPPEVYPVEAI